MVCLPVHAESRVQYRVAVRYVRIIHTFARQEPRISIRSLYGTPFHVASPCNGTWFVSTVTNPFRESRSDEGQQMISKFTVTRQKLDEQLALRLLHNLDVLDSWVAPNRTEPQSPSEYPKVTQETGRNGAQSHQWARRSLRRRVSKSNATISVRTLCQSIHPILLSQKSLPCFSLFYSREGK